MTPEREEAILREVARRSREIVKERLAAAGAGPLTIDEIEELVEQANREVARWLEERLIAEQTPEATNCAPCPRCARSARYKETLQTQLLTIHGQQPVTARYHYCECCKHGFCPADAVLGIEVSEESVGSGGGQGRKRRRRATRRVRSWMAKYGAREDSFAAVPPMLEELRGLVVSESTVERTTVEVGLALGAANEVRAVAAGAAALAEDDAAEDPGAMGEGEAGVEPGPSRLYLAMDGTMSPLRERWRKDGSLGKLVCRYGEAKVGMAFTTRQKEGLDTEIVTRGCVATLGNIVPFTLLMVWLARCFGAHRAKELVVLGDGAAWIWTLVRRYFPRAVQIVDLWHVLERLWTVAEAKCGSRTSAEAKAWMEKMRSYLEHDLVSMVIAELEWWEPQRKAQRALREEQLTFFAGNRERMKYKTYLARGYMVGSGPIESRCKQLVQSRLHEGGMHWREKTAEAVLAIRACLQSTEPSDLRAYA
jgi:hypothetical protein